jgi:hypothetical protein
MGLLPPTQDDDAEREDDRQADAMKAQLRKDVESWAKARSDSSPGRIAKKDAPAVKESSSRSVAGAKKARAPTTPVAKPAASTSKPFGMSYDGTTTAEYIQYMIDRGAR